MGLAYWITAIIALLAVAATAWAAYAQHRSAKATEAGTKATEASIAVTQEAAAASREAAEQTKTAVQIQLDERHDSLTPDRSIVRIALEQNPRTQLNSLFAYMTLDRDYRAHAVAYVPGNGVRTEISTGLNWQLCGAGEHRFHLEQWPPDRTENQATELVIRFWPPAEQDVNAQRWTCRCGRTIEPADPWKDSGHWDLRVPISYKA